MKIAFLLIGLIFSIHASAMPSHVIFMRHGEKGASGPDLSQQGWERAKALPELFKRPEVVKLGPPAALIAMPPPHSGGSKRAIETLKYLSEARSLKIESDIARDDVEGLVKNLKTNPNYDGKLVVVCWEHKVLVQIGTALGIKADLSWPDSQYDRYWVVSFDKSGKVTSFENLPEKLLDSDSSK